MDALEEATDAGWRMSFEGVVNVDERFRPLVELVCDPLCPGVEDLFLRALQFSIIGQRIPVVADDADKEESAVG